MDIMNIVSAVLVLFIMGVVFALLLGIAAKVFAVEVDERVPLVRECLPGANCGGCGYAGCDAMAAAIVEGTAPVNGCPVGGAACAAKIAEVLGVEAEAAAPKVAHVHCNGGCNAIDKAKYEGLILATVTGVSVGLPNTGYGVPAFGIARRCAAAWRAISWMRRTWGQVPSKTSAPISRSTR